MISPNFSFVVHDFQPKPDPESHLFTKSKKDEKFHGTYDTYNDTHCALCETTEKSIDNKGRKVVTFRPQICFFAAPVEVTKTYNLNTCKIEICTHCKPYIDGHEELPSDLSALFIPGLKDAVNYPESLKQAVQMKMFNMAVLLLDTMVQKKTWLGISKQELSDALNQSLLVAIKPENPPMIRLLLDYGAVLPVNSPEAQDAALLMTLKQSLGQDIDEKYASITRR